MQTLQNKSATRNLERGKSEYDKLEQFERALRIDDPSQYVNALALLDQLSIEEGTDYEPISDGETLAIVLPTRYYRQAKKLLDLHNIVSTEMRVASISELPAEKQAHLRGFVR